MNNYPFGQPNTRTTAVPAYATPFPQQTAPSSSITWVQGLSGAKAYPIAAGSTVLLMDTEDGIFYIKSADYSGMPLPLRIFDYKERVDPQEKQDFVTREEFDELKKFIEELR